MGAFSRAELDDLDVTDEDLDADRVRDSAPVPMTRRKRDSLDFPTSLRPGPPEDFDDLNDLPPPRKHGFRRIFIRLFGLAAVGALIYGTVRIAESPRARGEIAAWGTLGNPQVAATAGRGARRVVEAAWTLGLPRNAIPRPAEARRRRLA